MNARSNALMISPFMPDRAGTGAQQRAATLLDALRSRAEVTIWVLRGDSYFGLATIPPNTPTVFFPQSGPTAKKMGPSRLEWASRRAIAQELGRPAVLARAPFDLVMCFRLQSAVFLDRAEGEVGPLATRRITDLDDVESILVQRLARLQSRAKCYKAVAPARQVRWARRAEDKCLATHDLVLVASPIDELALGNRSGNTPLALAPNCVEFPRAEPRQQSASSSTVLTFVGNFGYEPNTDGIEWFARYILPKISLYTNFEFRIDVVGYNSHKIRKSLNHIPRIQIIGAASSLCAVYHESDIVIAPLRAGSGTRIKILEAMSYGLPVVSTPIGAEGIQAAPGEDIIIANGAVAFARSCARLMANPPLRQAIGARARSLIRTQYALDVVLPKLGRTIFD